MTGMWPAKLRYAFQISETMLENSTCMQYQCMISTLLCRHVMPGSHTANVELVRRQHSRQARDISEQWALQWGSRLWKMTHPLLCRHEAEVHKLEEGPQLPVGNDGVLPVLLQLRHNLTWLALQHQPDSVSSYYAHRKSTGAVRLAISEALPITWASLYTL